MTLVNTAQNQNFQVSPTPVSSTFDNFVPVSSPPNNYFSVIADQVTSHAPKLSDGLSDRLSVKIHTAASQDEKNSQDLSLNNLKAEKKKKKKKTAAQRAKRALAVAEVAKQFCDSPTLPSSLVKESVSLFSESCKSYCPFLNIENQAMLSELLKQSAFCDNINLFDAFLIDFAVIWDSIKAQVDTTSNSILHKELKEEILQINAGSKILKEVYLLYHFMYGRNESMFYHIIPQYFDEDIYRTKPQIIDGLKSISLTLTQILKKLNVRQLEISSNARVKTKAFYAEKFEIIFSQLNHFNQKINLLKDCLHSHDVDTLFLFKKTTDWSESQTSDYDHQKQLNSLSRFSTFIKSFIKIPHIISEPITSYIDIIENLVSNGFNKKSIINCISAQTCLTPSILEALAYVQQSIWEGSSKEKDAACLIHGAVTFEIYDKWLNDIVLTITSHSKIINEVPNFKTPERTVQRLVTLLDQMISFENSTSPKKLEIEINPSIKAILDTVENLILEAKCEFKQYLAPISFVDIRKDISHELASSSFRLSRIVLHIDPISCIAREFSFDKFEVILNELLHLVRNEKNSGQLDHLDHHILKGQIKEWLKEQCFELCTYAMIIAEANALTSQPEDILHLLPDELFHFLDLKCFDEIFSQPKAITTPANASLNFELEELETPLKNQEELQTIKDGRSPTEVEVKQINTCAKIASPKKAECLTALPTAPLLKKNQTLPQREDFYNADKKRLIDNLLSRMKFNLDHTTGSHDIRRSEITKKIIVVPKDVSKLGTRKSIYTQAFEALRTDYKDD